MAPAVRQAVAKDASIQRLRYVPLEAIYGLVGEAMFLVFPSTCYETFGRAVVEAFSKGTPVIVSGLGALAAIVDDGRSRLHFKPGDAIDLAATIRRILASPIGLARMRQAAREEFDHNFTVESNHRTLMAI